MRCPCVILQYFHFCQACSTFSAAHMFMNEMPHPNIKLLLSPATSNCQYISAEDGSFWSPPPIHTGIFNDRYYTGILSLQTPLLWIHECNGPVISWWQRFAPVFPNQWQLQSSQLLFHGKWDSMELESSYKIKSNSQSIGKKVCRLGDRHCLEIHRIE